MRRLVYLGLFVAIVPWLVVGVIDAAGEEDRGEHYFVRAIFDNAANLVDGEDVKVAGVPVGAVQELNVTDQNKAAVTLRIDDEDFIPWKQDASCTIKPQSLIGEKFLECEPGSSSADPLREIADGDGEGERLLPVTGTRSPVDIDLLNDILRLPYRQRFAILLSEFGTGLAGRGGELNEVIHRANPALRETDRLLATLADQNRVLARLARNGDEALAPLARERRRVSDWIVQANATGEASAERRDDIRRGIDRLPPFLRELRPLMADLEGLADEGTPVLRDLGAAAPELDRLIRGLGTFSEAGNEAFPSLGEALERGRPALIRARPLVQDLGRLGRQARPATANLDKLTASLQSSGGVERINDFLYYFSLATNGFDGISHYLRAGLTISGCEQYYTEPTSTQCAATYFDPFGADPASAGKARTSFAKRPDKRAGGGSVAPQGSLLQGLIGTPEEPALARERRRGLEALRGRASKPSPALRSAEPALDYLLGGER